MHFTFLRSGLFYHTYFGTDFQDRLVSGHHVNLMGKIFLPFSVWNQKFLTLEAQFLTNRPIDIYTSFIYSFFFSIILHKLFKQRHTLANENITADFFKYLKGIYI